MIKKYLFESSPLPGATSRSQGCLKVSTIKWQFTMGRWPDCEGNCSREARARMLAISYQFLIKINKEFAPGSPGPGSLQFPTNFLFKSIRKLLPGGSGPDPDNFLPISFKINTEIAPGSPGPGSWQFPTDFLLKSTRKLLLGGSGPDPGNFLPISY